MRMPLPLAPVRAVERCWAPRHPGRLAPGCPVGRNFPGCGIYFFGCKQRNDLGGGTVTCADDERGRHRRYVIREIQDHEGVGLTESKVERFNLASEGCSKRPDGFDPLGPAIGDESFYTIRRSVFRLRQELRRVRLLQPARVSVNDNATRSGTRAFRPAAPMLSTRRASARLEDAWGATPARTLSAGRGEAGTRPQPVSPAPLLPAPKPRGIPEGVKDVLVPVLPV